MLHPLRWSSSSEHKGLSIVVVVLRLPRLPLLLFPGMTTLPEELARMFGGYTAVSSSTTKGRSLSRVGLSVLCVLPTKQREWLRGWRYSARVGLSYS
eukprot:scaffold570327_cov43-Prasinocladus_malaysianus.AAC.1